MILLKGMFVIFCIAGMIAFTSALLITAHYMMDRAEKGKKLWTKHQPF